MERQEVQAKYKWKVEDIFPSDEAWEKNYAEAEIFKEEIQAAFPGVEFTFVDPLSLSVSCHIGPGALAIAACVKYLKK